MTGENPRNPEELLEQIRSFVAVAQEHVREGGDANLEGLDEKVKDLCEAVLDMPKPEADKYTDALQVLAEDLTQLKAGMEQSQMEVRQQLDSLNMRHKAVKAYTTTDAVDPNKKKND